MWGLERELERRESEVEDEDEGVAAIVNGGYVLFMCLAFSLSLVIP